MRIIDADKADVEFIRCYYGNHCYIEDVQEWLDEQPTIDAEPVEHGQWADDQDFWRCSLCLEWLEITQGTANMNFCPNCGAKMDGERK